jgi:hypothetical protein
MPKIDWAGEDDDALTAEDIEGAEEGFQAYAGEIPPGGVYRFILRRIKFKKASTGTKGLSLRLNLDGSWKPAHRKFDGCPLWDDVWFTKGSAAFVKALAQAIGVSAEDILNKVVVDEDGYVTKIGRKVFTDKEFPVYIAVKRGEYNDEPRLEKAGTGFQVVEADEDDTEDDTEEEETPKPAKKAAKAAPAKAAKGKGKSRNDDDEPPF